VEWLRGEIGNPDLSPEWFNQLGLISEAYTGDFNLARTCFQSAWDVAEKQNDKYQKALSMTNLGVLNLDQNRPAEAVEIFNELKPFVEKQFGDESRELAVACQNLASAYQLDGREEEAKEERIRATGILRKIS
jgi:tetratricopeptide (TPR) repeat protein